MQLTPIILVAVVMAASEGIVSGMWKADVSPAVGWVLAWGPVVLFVVLSCVVVASSLRYFNTHGKYSRLIFADRIVRSSRALVVVNHVVVVFSFGWLDSVRETTGDLIFVDEFIAVLPPVVGYIGLWWAYFPIDQFLRRATMVRQLDSGTRIYPPLSRIGYVVLQLRLQFLFLLVLLFAILALSECVSRVMPQIVSRENIDWVADVATFAGALVLFIAAPWIARILLDVSSLRHEGLRANVEATCRRHRVRIRNLLQWNTHGTMLNAAVMGIFGRIRYVLITDALLDELNEDQAKAVLAHEIGHVRCRHLPWLVASLIAALALGSIVAHQFADYISASNAVNEAGILFVQIGLAIWVFGWISRRFERQADTFSVKELSRIDHEGPPMITIQSVDAMNGALARIARVTAFNPKKRSWRHGSIAWRQRYLQTLIGKPLDRLPIDRLVTKIKLAVIIVLVIAAYLHFSDTLQDNGSPPDVIYVMNSP